MLEYIRISLFYRLALIRSIRVMLAFILVLLTTSGIAMGSFPRFPLFFLLLFVMSEIFYRFHIASIRPQVNVSSNTADPLLSCTKKAAMIYSGAHDGVELLNQLLKESSVKLLLRRLGIQAKEIVPVSIDKTMLIRESQQIAHKTGGSYITTADLIAAYFIYTQEQRKLLFTKEIRPEELLEVMKLLRSQIDLMELPKSISVHVEGEGIGEALVTGWTPLTQQYTTDWTRKALMMPRYIIGREQEYQELVSALVKKENNNVLLVGDPGIGKNSLLAALVQDSFSGVLPRQLNHKRLLELMVGTLLAGSSEQGTLEARLNEVIAEVAHSGNVLLLIHDFQQVLGSSDFHLNLAGLFLPYLKSGQLPIIATMTTGNFKVFFEQHPLQEVFTVISLIPPDEQTALRMLFAKASEIEQQYRCFLTYKAIQASLRYASVFLPDRVLPGSAVELLAQTANSAVLARGRYVLVDAPDVVSEVGKKTKVAVGAPSEEERQLLLHLEDKIHERVIDQEEAVRSVAEAIRRVREGLASPNKPISFLFLGPTGVGKTETAKALAEIYFKDGKQMVRLDMSEYADTDGVKRLLGSPPGEGSERGELTEKIHDHPYSLVLLDEFEKAHPTILDLFLQVLEDGRLTDNKGRTVSFVNTIIIATSNAASEFIREQVAKGGQIDKAFQQKLLEYLQTQHIFKPELLNRFDEVIVFKPLNPLEMQQVAKLLLDQLITMLHKQDITLVVDDSALTKIVSEGFDPQFGARPLRRYIEDKIEDVLARLKLEGSVKRGDTVRIGVDINNNLVANVERVA
jgi:ATP-dependent Clp protease ATP-binding subunit ClpC